MGVEKGSPELVAQQSVHHVGASGYGDNIRGLSEVLCAARMLVWQPQALAASATPTATSPAAAGASVGQLAHARIVPGARSGGCACSFRG